MMKSKDGINSLNREYKYKSLAKNTIFFGIGNFGYKIVQFLLLPILTFSLTKVEYGGSELIISTVDLLIPILTLGISEAVFRFANYKDQNYAKSVLTNSTVIVVIGSLILGFSLFIINTRLGYLYDFSLLFLFTLTALKNIFSQYLRGQNKVKEFTISGIINSITLILLALIFILFLDWKVIGYMLSINISVFLSILYLLFKTNLIKDLNLNLLNRNVFNGIIKYSIPTIPNMLSWWIIQTSTRYIVLVSINLEASGLYTAASKLPALLNIITSIFYQAWAIDVISGDESEHNTIYHKNVFKFYSLGIFISTSLILGVLPYISRFLLAGDFYFAWKYSIPLIIAALAGSYSSFFTAYYIAKLNTKSIMITTIIGAIVSVGLSFILIKYLGLFGPAISSAIAYSLIAFLRWKGTYKYSKIKIIKFDFLCTIIVIIIQSLILIYYSQFSILTLLVSLLLIYLINFKSINNIIFSIKKILLKEQSDESKFK